MPTHLSNFGSNRINKNRLSERSMCTCLSYCLLVCYVVCLSVLLLLVYYVVCLNVLLFVMLFVWMSCCLFVCLIVCLSVYLFLSICLHHRHLRKIDWLMACTIWLVCLVSTVSGRHKNALGKGSASSWHITKLRQSTFLFVYGLSYLSIFQACCLSILFLIFLSSLLSVYLC